MGSLKNLQLSIRVAEKSKKTSGLWRNDTSKNWAASSLCQSQSPQQVEMANNKLTRPWPRKSWRTNKHRVRVIADSTKIKIGIERMKTSSKLSHQHKDRMAALAQKLVSLLSNRDQE